MFILSLIRSDSSGERARRFLSWFRNLRQIPEDQGHLRWLLAGSVGLDTVTARLNLGDTINDLKIFHLGAFEARDADRLLQELSRTHELPLPADVRRHILDRIGWLIPYYIQLAFSELREESFRRPTPGPQSAPSIEDVDRAFESLLSPAKRAYFDYWRQRLDEELGRPDASFAAQILNAAAASDSGTDRDLLSLALEPTIPDALERQGKVRYLLDVLVSDGYLIEEGRRFLFRSPLLLEFWRKRVMP